MTLDDQAEAQEQLLRDIALKIRHRAAFLLPILRINNENTP